MALSTSTSRAKSIPFAGKKELTKVYGTSNGLEIKLDILWLHLQYLMNVHYPCDTPGTPEHAAMQRYKLHWVRAGHAGATRTRDATRIGDTTRTQKKRKPQ